MEAHPSASGTEAAAHTAAMLPPGTRVRLVRDVVAA